MGLAEGNALLEKAVAEREAFVEAFLAEEARLAYEAFKQARAAENGSSNYYPRFQCTWYAKTRRPDLPSHLGNANKWVGVVRKLGWKIGDEPKVGAVGQARRGNHVVYIEKVEGSRVYLSERNYDYRGSYRERWANASDFIYIY